MIVNSTQYLPFLFKINSFVILNVLNLPPSSPHPLYKSITSLFIVSSEGLFEEEHPTHKHVNIIIPHIDIMTLLTLTIVLTLLRYAAAWEILRPVQVNSTTLPPRTQSNRPTFQRLNYLPTP